MWKYFGVFIFASLLYATNGRGYDGYKIIDITPKTIVECDFLQNFAYQEDKYDFFSLTKLPGHVARVMVNRNEVDNFLAILKTKKIDFHIINEDVGNSINKELKKRKLLQKLRPITGHGRLSTDRFYSYPEILNYVEDLARRFPSRVFLKTVGKSYEGRLLKTLTITNGDRRTNKNVILVDGGFHAREWMSHASVLYLMEQLVENFNENSDLLLDYDWIVLPVVNPDGYEYTQIDAETRLWRKTRKHSGVEGIDCIGTDPNRNFDFHWNGEGASSDPCSNTYAGPHAFSEPEVMIVRDLIQTFKDRGQMYLTIHTYGSLILYPWGWTSDLPDTWEDLHEVAKAGSDAMFEATGSQYTIGSSTNVLYIAAGASDDYAFNAGFPISFTMELPRGGPNGFDPPAESIDSVVKETWIGIRAMGKKVMEKYPLKV